MKKNTSGQTIGAQLNSRADGTVLTSGVTLVYITGDGGTQALGQGTGSPSGMAIHEGNGYWSYSPLQAETNYDHIAFTFVNGDAVSVTVQVYTTFPQTGDSFTRIGAPAGASVSADIAGIQSDTNDIQARIPDALVSGNIKALVVDFNDPNHIPDNTTIGLIATDTGNIPQILDVALRQDTMMEATGSPLYHRWNTQALEQAPSGGSAPSAATIADAVWDEARAGHVSAGTFGEGVASVQGNVTGSVASVSGNVGGNVTGSVGSVASGGITSGSFAAGAINAAAIATNAIDADALASDAVTEMQSGLATSSALSSVAADVTSILADTAEIGTAGAGLSAIPWNSAWDTEVQSEAADALVAYDPPTHAELTSAVSGLATAASLSAVAAVTVKLDSMIELAPGSPTYYRWMHTSLEGFQYNAVEGTYTWQECARGWNSVLLGKASGMSSTTGIFRDLDDSKDRITATQDSSGNRTAVSRDLT